MSAVNCCKKVVLGYLTIVAIALVLIFSQLAAMQSGAQNNRNSTISNPFANNVQTWADNENGIKIQFTRSPVFPFVGNVTQLNFHVIGSNPIKPLELTNIRITLIKNVTANISSDRFTSNKNNFITFDNITATNGYFSLKYRFLEAGSHQIIVKINTTDGKVALGSFNIPVLRFWWNLF